MSKSKKKNKKKQNNANAEKPVKPRKRMHLVIAVIACVLGAALIVLLCCKAIDSSAKKAELCDVSWVSSSALNASGDEVELAEIYNTNYTTYQGSLNFTDDGKFTLWLTPGSADDGTHSGKYSVTDPYSIAVTFDEGTQTEFLVERGENNKITSIILLYDNYQVYFTSQLK